jgi:tyrosyl-tRNA synthetase
MTTGTELIRRTVGGEAYALTCPLITKADGKKFGKTESGNIWLDAKRTSPYKFYQFWLNVSDDDAERYIKIFTSLDKETIDALIASHREDPGQRILQKRLAEEVTVMVHSREDYEAAVEASNILFGKSTSESLKKLDEATLLDVFAGVPTYEIALSDLEKGIGILDLVAEKTSIFPSKGEARKMIQGNGFSLNKDKFTDVNGTVGSGSLLNGKYILAQKGKKNYFLLLAK